MLCQVCEHEPATRNITIRGQCGTALVGVCEYCKALITQKEIILHLTIDGKIIAEYAPHLGEEA